MAREFMNTRKSVFKITAEENRNYSHAHEMIILDWLTYLLTNNVFIKAMTLLCLHSTH